MSSINGLLTQREAKKGRFIDCSALSYMQSTANKLFLVSGFYSLYDPAVERKEFKSIRINLGLSQQEFGQKLGFSRKWARMRISEMERGKRPVSARTAILCELFLKKEKKQ